MLSGTCSRAVVVELTSGCDLPLHYLGEHVCFRVCDILLSYRRDQIGILERDTRRNEKCEATEILQVLIVTRVGVFTGAVAMQVLPIQG